MHIYSSFKVQTGMYELLGLVLDGLHLGLLGERKQANVVVSTTEVSNANINAANVTLARKGQRTAWTALFVAFLCTNLLCYWRQFAVHQ